ncbi:hypothetical protein RJ641_012644 [Dillenia turbinata]|uniref:Uncharacterized protein n=1 Tax=Dillenia turbinata TaxID=194707 RepID=A0AAN8V7G3_9MAGN
MGNMSQQYQGVERVGGRGGGGGGGGFRLNTRRFSIHRLRAKVLFLFKILNKWRSSCGRDSKLQKRSVVVPGVHGGYKRSSSGKRSLISTEEKKNKGRVDYGSRTYGRSNSFYAEAIADCLEFIKRTSISVDD